MSTPGDSRVQTLGSLQSLSLKQKLDSVKEHLIVCAQCVIFWIDFSTARKEIFIVKTPLAGWKFQNLTHLKITVCWPSFEFCSRWTSEINNGLTDSQTTKYGAGVTHLVFRLKFELSYETTSFELAPWGEISSDLDRTKKMMENLNIIQISHLTFDCSWLMVPYDISITGPA